MPSASSVTQRSVPGGWTEREVCVGDRTFRLVLPAEPDEFLEHLATPASGPHEELEPYWAALWPSARPTAEAVLDANWRPGERVLEIGCGIGLVGLAALARGLSVTFSDCVPIAISLALENARRNGFSQARSLFLDWRNPRAEQFPVILGSDVLYDTKNHEPLLGLLDGMLAAGGCCWLGDPGRYHTRAFLQRAWECGYAVRLCDASGAEIFAPRAGHFQLITLRHATK